MRIGRAVIARPRIKSSILIFAQIVGVIFAPLNPGEPSGGHKIQACVNARAGRPWCFENQWATGCQAGAAAETILYYPAGNGDLETLDDANADANAEWFAYATLALLNLTEKEAHP